METTSGWFIRLSTFAFIFWSAHATESQTYTILAAENHTCPSNSTCLTLVQFASTVYRHPSEIISLKLLPGNHTLDIKMVINNLQKLSLYALESASNGTFINCSPSAGLLFSSCDHVDVRNLYFNGCRNKIESVNNFTIMFSSFVGKDQFGSTLIINGTSYLKIDNCCFVSNGGFTGTSLSMPGKQNGVINATLCKTFVIMNSFFIKNTQAILIFVHHMTNIAIKNSSFENNSVDAIIHIESNSSVSVYDSTFTRNSFFRDAFALQVINSMLQVVSTGFTDSENVGTGGAIYAVQSSVSIEDSIFKHFNGSHNGGVIACYGGNISVCATVFENNAARGQGGVLYANSTDVIIKESLFRFNNALVGGALSLHWGTSIINESEFTNNSACASDMTNRARGGVLVAKRTVVHISNSLFENNDAESVGAIECYCCYNSTISNSGFYSNMAKYRGVLYVYKTTNLSASNLTFEYNVGNGGVIYIADSSMNTIFKALNYNFNNGSIVALATGLTFYNNCIFYNNKPGDVTEVSVFHNQGGVITSFQSSLVFDIDSESKFIDNYGKFGGAIYAVKTGLHFYGEVLLSGNRAVEDGGGIYLYQAGLFSFCSLTLKHNVANNSGGGIYMVGESIKIFQGHSLSCTSRSSIVENSASYGGGIFLSNNAMLYVLVMKSLCDDIEKFELRNNHADYGGALYVADNTSTGICQGQSHNNYVTTPNSMCALQSLLFDYHTTSYNKSVICNKEGILYVQNNTAKYAGSNLFGGLLDRCSLNPHKYPLLQDVVTGPDSYLEYLNQGSLDLESISSNPVKICLCINNQPDCNHQPSIKYVKKGELFNIPVVAVDQVNHTVNATIHCTLSSSEAGLGEGQLSQTSVKRCTSLKFQLSSPFGSENLTLYADGPCKDATLSQLSIPVMFLPCTCLIGFQPLKSVETSCICECDYRLQHYGIACNVSSWSLIRENSYWINHVNMTENVSGFVYYAHCPYDYCHPPSFKLSINFNTPSGADAQCSFNRTGVLCGACKPDLSLSLGSSRCLKCPTTWPVSIAFVLLGSAFAGFLLVALILILNITVATGTINGLIFYANIIGTNSRVYLPFVRPNFLTIFIAWLNLEFGFDFCFFEGMDAYAKTWLQLSFSSFLFFIVAAIIFISNRSSRFSQLIGRKSLVATLATLILLTFTKILRIAIAIFSLAVLIYPNNTINVLWLIDASVQYLKGKHIPLFIVAVLIVIADIIFILLLLLWRLILHTSILKILEWLTNTRIHDFIDSYLTLYTPKFRFWTGLLLIARVLICLISTVNVSGDPVIDLIAVGIVMVCLILIKIFLREKIYQKLWIELLEITCYFNMLLFTIVSFFLLESPWHHRIFAGISVGIMFAVSLFVLFYHLFRTLQQHNSFNHLIAVIVFKVKKKNTNSDNFLESQNVEQNIVPTSSVIDMDSCLLCNNNETQDFKQKEKQVDLKVIDQNDSLENQLDPLGSIHAPLL